MHDSSLTNETQRKSVGQFLGMTFLTDEREVKEGSPLLLPPFLELRMLSWEVVMWCSSSHPVTVRWIL